METNLNNNVVTQFTIYGLIVGAVKVAKGNKNNDFQWPAVPQKFQRHFNQFVNNCSPFTIQSLIVISLNHYFLIERNQKDQLENPNLITIAMIFSLNYRHQPSMVDERELAYSVRNTSWICICWPN